MRLLSVVTTIMMRNSRRHLLQLLLINRLLIILLGWISFRRVSFAHELMRRLLLLVLLKYAWGVILVTLHMIVALILKKQDIAYIHLLLWLFIKILGRLLLLTLILRTSPYQIINSIKHIRCLLTFLSVYIFIS